MNASQISTLVKLCKKEIQYQEEIKHLCWPAPNKKPNRTYTDAVAKIEELNEIIEELQKDEENDDE